ncbi:hypothetical protein EWM64_g3401 [Hericium alpestre]|uniref:BAG domain-containing protein n=1 Tax=Hericium alpestre TaxID=135208 RepID=A0A4Z0A319_9AGAM|nr:hypothetical protein EWM64_g3401 [Hericium alpestre]
MLFVNPITYSPVSEPIQEYTFGRRAPATCREACYIPQAANPIARSEERYRHALVEVHAAEAEYVRTQKAARQEAIRKERKRLLQAEVQRLEHERQNALREERERQARIELLRRQLLSGEDEEESVTTFLSVHVSRAPVEFLAKTPRHNSAPAPLKTRLEERLHKESDKDVEEALQNLLSNIFGRKVPAATPERPAASTRGTQPAPSNKPAQAPKPAPAVPLKDRLEERLQKESDEDVEDTLQNLLSSIFGQKVPTTTTDAPAASTSGTRSAPSSAPEKTEGANLARAHNLSGTSAVKVQTAYRAHRHYSYHGVHIYSRFRSSRRAVPPAQRNQFRRALAQGTDRDLRLPALARLHAARLARRVDDEHEGLAYTPTNAPVRAYEHALNHLLERLDAVESEGDEEVRRRRKEVVLDVERALAEVDRRLREMRAAGRAREVEVAVDIDVQAVVETTEVAAAPEGAPAVEAVELPSAAQSYSIPIADGTPATNDEVESAEAAASPEALPAAVEVDGSHNTTQTNDASVVDEAPTPTPAADVQEPSSVDTEEPANTSPQTVTIVISEPDTVPTAREADNTAAAGAEETASPAEETASPVDEAASPVDEDIDSSAVESLDSSAARNTESSAAGTESPAPKSTDSLVVESTDSPAVGSENMEPATADISENAEPQNAASVHATYEQPSSHIDAPVPAAEAVHLDVAAPLSAPASAEPAHSSSSSTEAEVALPEEVGMIVQDMDSTSSAESSPGPEFLSALSEEQFTFPSAPVRDEDDAVMVENASEEGSEHSWEHIDA